MPNPVYIYIYIYMPGGKVSIMYEFTSQQLKKCNELILKCCHKNRFKYILKRLIAEKLIVVTIIGKINGISNSVYVID